MTEEGKKELKKIYGFRADLEGERSVFVGKHEGEFYLMFKNNGRETKIKLSAEAMEAVIALGLEHFGLSA